MKFKDTIDKALWLGQKFAQQNIPGTDIKVRWILPIPIDPGMRNIFTHCFDSRVPFGEYFKNMQDCDVIINVIGMDRKFYPMYEICEGFEYLCDLTERGLIFVGITKSSQSGLLSGICTEETNYTTSLNPEWNECLIIRSNTIINFWSTNGKIEFDTQINLRYDWNKRSLEYYTDLAKLADLEINKLLNTKYQHSNGILKISQISVRDLIKNIDPFLS